MPAVANGEPTREQVVEREVLALEVRERELVVFAAGRQEAAIAFGPSLRPNCARIGVVAAAPPLRLVAQHTTERLDRLAVETRELLQRVAVDRELRRRTAIGLVRDTARRVRASRSSCRTSGSPSCRRPRCRSRCRRRHRRAPTRAAASWSSSTPGGGALWSSRCCNWRAAAAARDRSEAQELASIHGVRRYKSYEPGADQMPMPSGNARPWSIVSGGCGLPDASNAMRRTVPVPSPGPMPSGVDDDADVGVVHRAVGPDADTERRAGRERLRAEHLAGRRLQDVAHVLAVGGELGDHAVEDARHVEVAVRRLRDAALGVASVLLRPAR